MAGLDAFEFPEVPGRLISKEEEGTCAAMEALETRSFELRSNRQFKKWNGVLDYFMGSEEPTAVINKELSMEEVVNMEAQGLNKQLLSQVIKEIDEKKNEEDLVDEFLSLAVYAVPEDKFPESDELLDYESLKDELEVSEDTFSADQHVIKTDSGEVVNESWQEVGLHVAHGDARSTSRIQGLVNGASVTVTTAFNRGLGKITEIINNL